MAAWATTTAQLKQKLKSINPFQGVNPLSNCVACAQETARVLTTGAAPGPVASNATPLPGLAITQTFNPGPNRPQTILNWLSHAATAPGVYVVEGGEDHAWNYVKTTNRRLYIVDSNQHRFIELAGIGDFECTVYNANRDQGVLMNYADDPDDEDIDLYFAGPLNPAFNTLLQGGGHQTSHGRSATWD